jgi:molecular chaperone GrpE
MAEPTPAPADGAEHGSFADEFAAQFADGEAHQGPVVRDRRRLDPLTGKVREAYANAPAPEPAAVPPASGQAAAEAVTPGQVSDELVAAESLAEELVADLQRLNAEYVNYRKRVERDRAVARDTAVATVLEALLPVLDELHLARQHGDLEQGPFVSIAEKLEVTLERFGLARYGEVGEEFDPTVHEALMHTQAELAPGTLTTTVVQVLQPGYRAQDRILRAARVAVADPAD